MNRVSAAIRRMREQIQERINLGITTERRVESTRQALDMDTGEFVRFQELKSLAVASGKLSAEEGQLVYTLLGNTPEHFNRQDAATKTVLTQLFRELLEA